MVDPISITCAIGSLVAASTKVAKVLRRFIQDAGNIDDTVQSLLIEVRSISTVSEEMEKRCKGNMGVLTRYAAEEGELWSAIAASIDDCKATLFRLDEVLEPLGAKKRFWSSQRRTMSLDWSASNIVRLRQQLHTHCNAMQLGLSTVLISLHSQTEEMDRENSKKLDQLMSCILEVKKSIERGGVYDQFAELNEKDGRVSKNLRHLTMETESFHGRSQSKPSVWNGSNIGDTALAERKKSMQTWIQAGSESEEDSSPLGGSLSESKLEAAALSEEDMHAPLVQAMLRNAVTSFEDQNYLGVEGTLRRALQYCHDNQFVLGDISAVIMMLAYVLAVQAKWAEAEVELLPPAGQRIVKADLILKCDILALTFMNKNDFETAIDYCEQSRKMKLSKKKDKRAVYQSISLMAEIYQKKEVNGYLATGYLSLIPADIRQSAGETKLHDSILSPSSESIKDLKQRLVSDEMVVFNSTNVDQRSSIHDQSCSRSFSNASTTRYSSDPLHRADSSRHHLMHIYTAAATDVINLDRVDSPVECDTEGHTLRAEAQTPEMSSPGSSNTSSPSHRNSSTPTMASTISYVSQRTWIDASPRGIFRSLSIGREKHDEKAIYGTLPCSSNSSGSVKQEYEKQLEKIDSSTGVSVENIDWSTALRLDRTFHESRGSGGVKVAFSPNNNLLVSKVSLGFSLWDLTTGSKRFERGNKLFGENSAFADSISFSPDSKLVLTVENSVDGDRLMKWNTESDLAYCTPKHYKGNITSARLFPNGRRTVLASRDGIIRIIDTATGQIEKECKMHKKAINCLALSKDGSLIASSSTEYTAKVWCVETDIQSSLPAQGKDVRDIAFSPVDRSLVALASNDCTVKLWDATNGQDCRILVGHTDKVYSVAFAPNGKLLASSSRDCTIKLWDLASGRNCHTITLENRVHSIALSPDGKLLASGESVRDAKNVKIWAGPFS